MVAKHLSRRAVVLFALASFCLITLTLLSNRLGGVCQDGTYCRNSLGSIRSSNPGRPGGSCSGFPDTSKVLVVMKTTASEAYQKLPAQFMTSLRCASDYIIFSDAEQELGGVQILDGLDQVVDQVKDSNTDFDLYRRQQECLVDLETCTRYDNVTEQATNLDKYKYIHMAEKAFRLKPNYDWYVFVDADTWFSWATLVQWLKHLNAEEEVYFGSAARFGPTAFASGRSGYGVSKAMMRRMFANRKRVAGRWDWGLMESCCGDVMFATAIKEMTKVIVRDTVRRWSSSTNLCGFSRSSMLTSLLVANQQRRQADKPGIWPSTMVPTPRNHAHVQRTRTFRDARDRENSRPLSSHPHQGSLPPLRRATHRSHP